MNNTTVLRWAAVVAGIVLVGALVTNSCQSTRRERQAQVAEQEANRLRQAAEDRLSVAQAALEANLHKVDTLKRTDTLLRVRVKEVLAQPVPDTCRKVVEPLKLLVLDQSKEIEQWRGAWDSLRAATDKILVGVDTLKASNDSLRHANALLKPRHYDILGRLLHPEIKPALFAGVCVKGNPCAGVGAAITF